MIGSELPFPWGVAVDGSGNLYVADGGCFSCDPATNPAVYKENLQLNGRYIQSTITSGISCPWDVAVDASGNVYISDDDMSAVYKENYADAPSFIFTTEFGEDPAARDVTVQNQGNSLLNISEISSSANFPLINSANSCALNSQTLAQGATCGLTIEFTPTEVGSITGSVVLTSDNLNATGAEQTIKVQGTATPDVQTITFPYPGMQNYGTPLTLHATASSGLPVSFASMTPSVCTVAGTTATFLAAGSWTSGLCTIKATQPGNADYAPATPVLHGFMVNHATQTITFANPGPQTYGTPLTLHATASSGLPVSFASTTASVCTVSGNTVTFVTTGNWTTGACTIKATQAGNTDYAAALEVGHSFVVNHATQTITFANPGPQVLGTPLTLHATASSGLPVSFASTTTSVCTVAGNTVTFVTTGYCTIKATQPGNVNYAAAPAVGHTFTVAKAAD